MVIVVLWVCLLIVLVIRLFYSIWCCELVDYCVLFCVVICTNFMVDLVVCDTVEIVLLAAAW